MSRIPHVKDWGLYNKYSRKWHAQVWGGRGSQSERSEAENGRTGLGR